jgi:uncharacterized cysteine cluster protein YcgN (CxxCxxCC family)
MSVNLLTDFFGFPRSYKISAEVEQRFANGSLCQKCGRCCHGSIHYKGVLVMLPELPCKYLNRINENMATCSVYEDRNRFAKWCQRVSRESIGNGLFPADCPYTQGIAGYRGKALLPEEEQKKFYEWLKKMFSGQPRPEYLKESDWDNFLDKLGIK